MIDFLTVWKIFKKKNLLQTWQVLLGLLCEQNRQNLIIRIIKLFFVVEFANQDNAKCNNIQTLPAQSKKT